MRISDWRSDVCSSDLLGPRLRSPGRGPVVAQDPAHPQTLLGPALLGQGILLNQVRQHHRRHRQSISRPPYPKKRLQPPRLDPTGVSRSVSNIQPWLLSLSLPTLRGPDFRSPLRSEEHTYELKSLMRIS